jgi:AmmeMemoRadiSam system protein A
MLSDEQKRELVRLARAAIVAQVTGVARPRGDRKGFPDASGAFVTIKSGEQLRGCLGSLHCRNGLADEIVRCAADAATEDPRFPPVAPHELPALSVEVSVLDPLEQIDPGDPDAIVPGRHGLVVEQNRRRGLLLPQVATEWGWTREQFLRQTCLKAGLPPDAWQHGASVYRFTAEVFAESALGA